MSNWHGKYVIGLTGNIATGKSIVRRMLEHLGAYTIDADMLSHRAMAKGAPGYQPVLDRFGMEILDANGEIDRGKLGHLVFTDTAALRKLESIIHPLVEQAIDLMIQRASQNVIVIEAIKLLEGKLSGSCDSIWVTYSPEKIQKNRLMDKRGMNAQEAIRRIHGQSPQELKIARANIIINNSGSFTNTWKQVAAAWKVILPAYVTKPEVMGKGVTADVSIQRGLPRDSARIAAFISRLNGSAPPLSSEDIMSAFGDKAFLLLMSGNQLVGLAGWQVENLVSRTTELFLDPRIPMAKGLKNLVTEVERASRDLQCEASLLFLPPQLAAHKEIWNEMGYSPHDPLTLGVSAWRAAAKESQPVNTILLIKQLRQDRVLRPI